MIEAVVIGVSAGGMKALSTMLPQLPENPAFAAIVVQHLPDDSATPVDRVLELREIASFLCELGGPKRTHLPTTLPAEETINGT